MGIDRGYLLKNLEQLKLKPDHIFSKLPGLGLVLACLSFLLFFLFASKDGARMFQSFYIAWIYFISLSIGAISFLVIQYAAKVGTSVIVRRVAENIAASIFVFIPFLIMMFYGMDVIFKNWLPASASYDAANAWYLNKEFFLLRVLFYFLCLGVIAFIYIYKSRLQDKKESLQTTRFLQNLSYPTLFLLALVITFLSIDMLMSLDPHWYSTIFGFYFFAGSYLAFSAVLAIFSVLLSRAGVYNRIITRYHFHDLGKYVFAYTCFWAYCAFSQYLLIWYANIPEETMWYALRQSENWLQLSLLLIVAHFVLPFLFFLPESVKKNPKLLIIGSLWMLVIHFVDLYWILAPNFYKEMPVFDYKDVLVILGFLGLFLAVFGFFSRRSYMIPINDPWLNESLDFRG